MKKRRVSKLGLLVLLLIVVILVTGISIIIIKSSNKTEVNIISEHKNYNLKINYPILKNKKLDNKIKEDVTNAKDEFMKAVKENNTDIQYDFNIHFSKDEYKEISTVHLVIESFTGGAHYARTDKTYTLNKKTKEEIELSNIFEDKNYLNTLSSLSYYYVMDYSSNYQKNFDDALVKEGTKPIKENFSHFALTEKGLQLLFPPYQVASHADGEVIITIPYERVNGILKKEYQGISQKGENTQTILTAKTRDLEAYKGKKLLALTFDDGPGHASTNYLLDELQKRDARVTFFVLGSRVEQYPDVLKREYTDGHEIGSHTYNHKNLFHLTDYEIMKELQNTNDVVKKYTGYTPTLLRPPYGNINDHIKGLTNMNTILWDVDTLDWKLKDKNKIASAIVNHAADGSIILLHDIYQNSVQGAIMAIDILKNQGYEFVTISEMAELKGIMLDKNKSYFSF